MSFACLLSKSITRGSIGMIALILGAVLLPTHTYALEVSPLKQTIVLEAGTSGLVSVLVRNDTDEPAYYVAEIDAFTIDPQSGRPEFGQRDDALNWIAPEVPSFRLAPGAERELAFLVSVPAGTIPRSHYLGLFIKSAPAPGQVAIGSRVGSLLFLHVAGTVVEDVAEQFFSVPGRMHFSAPVPLTLGLYNHGTIHAIPTGEIIVQNARGKVIGRLPINNAARNVLPGGRWEENYRLDKLGWLDTGPITLRGHIVYGATNQTITTTTSFWYVPVGVVIGAGIVVVGGVLVVTKRL